MKKDLAPLRRLVGLLGPDWDFFVSDVSTHKGGNNERMAFVYNVTQVKFRNLIGEIVISKKDDEVMHALKGSKLRVPDFGPTNMGGNRWFDQMAFTEKGKAGNKTRLLRHGKFDWRHAVFGPHPKDKAPELTANDKSDGKGRPSAAAILAHYKRKVEKIRRDNGKAPYANGSRSYRNWTTFEMSDHLPIWMELEIDY